MAQWMSRKGFFLVALLVVAAALFHGLAVAQGEATGSGTPASTEFRKDLPSDVAETPPPPPIRPEGSFFSVAAASGGTIFWVLIVLAIGGVLVSMERFLSLQKGRVDVVRFMGDISRSLQEKGVHGALEICSKNKGPIGQVVMYGLQRAGRGAEGVEKAVATATLSQLIGMRRGLGILNFVGQTAPLLGFLGTVMGLLHAFDAALQTGRVSAPQAIGGVSEAVVTTTTGIAVAIVMNVFSNLISARIDQVSVQMEEAGDELVDAVHKTSGVLKGRTA